MSKDNAHIAKAESILGILYNKQKDIIEPITWTTAAEAKQAILILRQRIKELRIVKHEVVAAKRQVHANFADKKAYVESPGTRLFWGAKAAGKANAAKKHALDQQKLGTLHPYQEAENFIDQAITQLERMKMEMELWLLNPPK